MKFKLRKILSIFLAVFLVLTFAPVGTRTAFASPGDDCAIGGLYFPTLDEALTAVQNGQSITLLKNIVYTNGITIIGKSFTFALNSYTLNVTNESGGGLEVISGSVALTGSGAFNVTGSTFGVYANTATVTVTDATATDANGYGAYALSGGHITINGDAQGGKYGASAYSTGTVTVIHNATGTGDLSSGAYASGSGTITVHGNAQGTYSGAYAYDAGSTVTVTGNATATDSGAMARNGGGVTVGGNAQGGSIGAYVDGAGSTVTVTGDVSATGGTGAMANGSSSITIDGTISAATYIQVGGTIKTEIDKEATTTKAGYYTYSNNINTVWVKEVPGPELPAMGGTVTINGITKFGETITAVTSINYNPPTLDDVPTYQWKRNGASIAGATDSTYALVQADIDKTITVTVTADGTHATGSITSTATVAVEKADGPAVPAAPVLASKTNNSVTLVANASYEFSEDGGANWQDSNVFTGLLPLTAYTFTTRVKETTTQKASVASAGISITTAAAPEAETVNVTFIKNGGDTEASPTTKTAVSGGNVGSLPTAPTRSGYTFSGWNTQANGNGTAFTAITPVIGDITVYAQWTANQIHNGGGGGGGLYTPSPVSSLVNGSVIDSTTGTQISSIQAAVTTNNNGTVSISMNAAQAVILKQPDGTTSSLSDFSKVAIITESGTLAPITADGTIQVQNLTKGTDSSFNITYDLGNGQKITIGTMNIKVDSSGKVSLTIELIDPYGIITDEATGKVIDGVNVTLYYANTDRNKATGKSPDTLVPLPGIDGFKPNNNRNPQISDTEGAYGFMVFSNSDYYLVATKDGYIKYTSSTISVELEIVKWNFKMHISGTERLFGQSRVDTALEIAKATYSNYVSNVVLATSENYPDALAGSVLAYKLEAPILLVGSTDIDQQKVLAYLNANMDSAGTVYILGGSGAVSKEMEAKVSAGGFQNINRIGGVDKYETAVNIANTLELKLGTPIVLVSGDNYPDALSISSIAAVNQYPIFLVKKDGIPDSVKQAISIRKPSKVYIIGLQGVISSAVDDQAAQNASIDKANVVRIGGVDRFETSLEVAKYFNLSGIITCVTTGNNYPDALAGSIYAAKYKAPIILVDKTLSDKAMEYLKNFNLSGATIFGGEAAVSKDIQQQLSSDN